MQPLGGRTGSPNLESSVASMTTSGYLLNFRIFEQIVVSFNRSSKVDHIYKLSTKITLQPPTPLVFSELPLSPTNSLPHSPLQMASLISLYGCPPWLFGFKQFYLPTCIPCMRLSLFLLGLAGSSGRAWPAVLVSP